MRVLVDGAVQSNVIEARVVSTNYYSGDWFELAIASEDIGSWSTARWTPDSRPTIEIQVALAQGDPWVSLIVGTADCSTIDLTRKAISLHGRDLSARLVDSSINRVFQNQTGSEIVALLGAYHGLKPNVVPTPDLVGRLFGGVNEIIADVCYSPNRTDWDLVVRLAAEYGYDAYVTGYVLHFKPRILTRRPSVVLHREDLMNIRFSYDHVMAGRESQRFVSWSSQFQRAFQSTADALSEGAGVPISPNLVGGQMVGLVSKAINDRWHDPLSLQATMPGETTISARSVVTVDCAERSLNGDYRVICVDRSFNAASGFTQRIRASRQA